MRSARARAARRWPRAELHSHRRGRNAAGGRTAAPGRCHPVHPGPHHRGPTFMNASTLFAPTGRLRAAINLGNPILAGRGAATGEPKGVSVDLARAFGERLGLDIELVV